MHGKGLKPKPHILMLHDTVCGRKYITDSLNSDKRLQMQFSAH